jgi:hypothetical protein
MNYKKSQSRALFLLFLMLSSLFTLFAFSSGDGSLGDPFHVSSCDDLQNISNYLNSNFTQINDIDCGVPPYNTGAGFDPIGGIFTGTYDGQNYNISNLFINRSTSDYIGLFNRTSYAQISKVNLIDANVIGASYVGSLIGRVDYGSLNDSYFQISINSPGSYALGGAIGRAFHADIDNISSSGSIYSFGGSSVGGLIGYCSGASSSLTNSYSTVDIVANDSYVVGGLSGYFYRGYVENSYSSGTIYAPGGDSIGGVFGGNCCGRWVIMNNTYATGDVTGRDNVGGLIGYGYGLDMENSYATGDVTGRHGVGGLLGYANYQSLISNSYYYGHVNGSTNVGGLIGDSVAKLINTSYAIAIVEGESNVGGLIGRHEKNFAGIKITNSFSRANVNGTLNVGGLIGELENATVDNSYHFGEVEGVTNVGGLIGNILDVAQLSNSFAISNVSGSTNVGGIIGVNNNSALTNNYWLNNTNNPNISIGFDNNAQSGFTYTSLSDFYNVSNAPFSGNWDSTDVWSFASDSLPNLVVLNLGLDFNDLLIEDVIDGISNGSLSSVFPFGGFSVSILLMFN